LPFKALANIPKVNKGIRVPVPKISSNRAPFSGSATPSAMIYIACSGPQPSKKPLKKPPTLLIDSDALDNNDQINDDFKNIFSSSKTVLADFSGVKTDMHSHLIPGINDGARTIEDSIALARRMHELGYRKLITTPHIQQDYFKNTPEIILGGLEKVRTALKAENISVEIEAAAEYLLDDGFEELAARGNLLTFSGKHILVELSYFNPNPNLKTIVFNLQVDGYKVILAHPERYTYWFSSFEKYEDLKDRGVLFQMNLVSLAGFYPDPVKKYAEKFIEKGMIDLVGTDMHNMNYMAALENSLKEKSLARLIESGKLLNNML